jgi:ribonuclease Z
LLKAGERFFLIDCGEGTQMRLKKFGLNPARIHHIFISHLHGDHVFGLFGLLSTLGMMGRKVPLHLYGPLALSELMAYYSRYFGPLPFELIFASPAESEEFIYENDRITVTAIPLKHRTQTFGYLFREKSRPLNVIKEQIDFYGLGLADVVKAKRGEDFVTESGERIANSRLTLPPYQRRSYAYISDTAFDPGLSEKVHGVNLLFHEATFAEKDKKLAAQTLHSTASQAATIARDAGVNKLLIGHFSTRYKDTARLEEEAREIFSHTIGVNDGDVYSVPLRRQKRE